MNHAEIRVEALLAAGNWEMDAAWSRAARIVNSKHAGRALVLAAIEAVASVRPREAGRILLGLTDSDDEDIADAALEAMAMAEGVTDEDFDDEDLDQEDDELF